MNGFNAKARIQGYALALGLAPNETRYNYTGSLRTAFDAGYRDGKRAVDETGSPSEADAFMFGLAGIRRGRHAGKARELGMGYGGQQAPKDQDIYKEMADVIFGSPTGRLKSSEPEMQNLRPELSEKEKKLRDALKDVMETAPEWKSLRGFWGADYSKEGTRDRTAYTVKWSDYARQAGAAVEWERQYNQGLKEAGWQWDASRLCWWHFWQPGTVIYPG